MSLSLPEPPAGTVARETLPILDRLPTGEPESIPVVVANGSREGPTLWVTGAIHGDEVTPVAVCQDIIHEGLVDSLAGRLVVIPTLNPAGLRRTTRTSYYDEEDPNRQFPDIAYVESDAMPADTVEGPRPPTQQQILCRRLFESFAEDADALLDLHTATVDSQPFVILDRVLYDRGLRDRVAATTLAERTADLAAATGLPVVREYPPDEYHDEDLHRSTSGSALNAAGIPALTVELGSPSVVDDALHDAGLAAVFRAMGHLDMVVDAAAVAPDAMDSLPAPITPPLSGPVRRYVGPHVPAGDTGIVRHQADVGDVVPAGDAVAHVLDPTGDPDTATPLFVDDDAWVLARTRGVAGYEHTDVAWLAVEGDSSLVGAPEESG